MTHNYLKTCLSSIAGQAFVQNLLTRIYGPELFSGENISSYHAMEEFTIEDENGQCHRLDMLFLVHCNNHIESFTIGIEIKGELSDLRADNKIQNYLGWTDYVFIAVPSKLETDAMKKAGLLNDHIGVVNATSGFIIKWPKLQSVNRYRNSYVYSRIYDHYIVI